MPTRRQIEVAAEAMKAMMFASHELPLDEYLSNKYLDLAEAALIAAEMESQREHNRLIGQFT